MPFPTRSPIVYLITGGETTPATLPSSEEFQRLLDLIKRAVDARVTLVQLREKRLSGRVLYELAAAAAELTRGTETRILVNDRADVALAAGCDGVHLTTTSLETAVVRRAFGERVLIGVSAHSLREAEAARDGGADFALFGPVFDTPSKRAYGPPLGLDALAVAARALAPFPLVAVGGVTQENAQVVLGSGARGVAAIRAFAEARNLKETLREINAAYEGGR